MNGSNDRSLRKRSIFNPLLLSAALGILGSEGAAAAVEPESAKLVPSEIKFHVPPQLVPAPPPGPLPGETPAPASGKTQRLEEDFILPALSHYRVITERPLFLKSRQPANCSTSIWQRLRQSFPAASSHRPQIPRSEL